jgi:hypothetical protein
MEFDGYLGHAGEQRGVLCDCQIWLAKDASEDSWLELSVPSSDAPIWVGPGPLTLKGKLGENGEIEVSGIWIKSAPGGTYPPRLAGRRQFGLAHIDRITERYQLQRSDGGESIDYALRFSLTDCKYVSPSKAIESSYTGGVAIRTAHRFEVLYPPLGRVVFERHFYTYKRDDIAGAIQTSELVAEIGDVRPDLIEDIEATESLMSDACLLASLAARHRILVLGMYYATPDELHRSWDTPLKRHRPSPQDEMWDGLIDRAEFEKYFRIAAEKFCAMADRDKARIREAIYPLVPMFSLGSVETEFLALFSALEALIRIGQIETAGGPTIVDADRWRIVKGEVRKAINALGAEFSHDERDAIRQKIGELNRPSVKAAMNRFLHALAVPTDDLWPIFGSHELPGLSEIRNRLAHGDAPADEATGALGMAKDHLALLLERSLLLALGYSIEHSRASVALLPQVMIVNKQEIEQLRRVLSNSASVTEDEPVQSACSASDGNDFGASP